MQCCNINNAMRSFTSIESSVSFYKEIMGLWFLCREHFADQLQGVVKELSGEIEQLGYSGA